MSSKIVLYKGSRGRGKTLTMIKDGYKYKLAGYRVLSNMKSLFWAEYIPNEDVLKLNKDSDLHNCVLILDEIQVIFDSRNFSNKENKSFSYFIMQIRKRHIIILGTTQFTDAVEKRFRQNLDIVCSPKYYPEMDIVVASYFDITILEDVDFNGIIKPRITVFYASQVFPLYDTNEMLV
jgi:hypothetical protein